MKHFVIVIMCLLGVVASVNATEKKIKEGKYMFSAPALYAFATSKIEGVYEKEIFVDVRYEDKTNYYLSLLNGSGHYLKFEIIDSDKLTIVGSRLLGNRVKGSGKLIGNEMAKGQITVISTAWGDLFERSTSEWFFRPATQEEIDENLLRGLNLVHRHNRQKGLSQTKENIINHLGSGGTGYSYSDIPQIKQILESGEIEYKDGEFIIHREKVEPEEAPPAPDISPKFQREKISLEEVKRELNITDTPTTPHEKAIHAHTAKQKSDLESPPSDPLEEQTEKSTPEEKQQADERAPVTFIVLGLIVFCIIVVVVYRNRNKKR